jgi:hypothetical protein
MDISSEFRDDVESRRYDDQYESDVQKIYTNQTSAKNIHSSKTTTLKNSMNKDLMESNNSNVVAKKKLNYVNLVVNTSNV